MRRIFHQISQNPFPYIIILLFSVGAIFCDFKVFKSLYYEHFVYSYLQRSIPVDINNYSTVPEDQPVLFAFPNPIPRTYELDDFLISSGSVKFKKFYCCWKETQYTVNDTIKYSYSLVWSKKFISSRFFHHPYFHHNPFPDIPVAEKNYIKSKLSLDNRITSSSCPLYLENFSNQAFYPYTYHSSLENGISENNFLLKNQLNYLGEGIFYYSPKAQVVSSSTSLETKKIRRILNRCRSGDFVLKISLFDWNDADKIYVYGMRSNNSIHPITVQNSKNKLSFGLVTTNITSINDKTIKKLFLKQIDYYVGFAFRVMTFLLNFVMVFSICSFVPLKLSKGFSYWALIVLFIRILYVYKDSIANLLRDINNSNQQL